MNIEELAKKFITLASKPTLSKAEHEEARTLMRQLREAGMSNEELSKLSKGKWTPSTIKFYTPGIKPAHPSQWEDSVALLDKLISSGLTLDDVGTAVTVSEDLKSHGVNLDNVIDLLLAADSSSLEIADLIQQYELFGESGLSPKNVSEALSLKEELERRGLGLDSLAPLVELAKNQGEPRRIIQALSKYASLNELSEQVDSASGELESLNQQIDEKCQQMEEVETKLTKLKMPIEAYEKAIDLGFTEHELAKLSGLTQKYGGVKEVLKAIEAYASLFDILNKNTKAKAELSEVKANISKLETQYAHLKTAITMCQTLIQQYKFGIDAISTIFSIAKKYGEPLDVLKAIEAYGKLQVVQHELGEFEGKVNQCKELLGQLQGEYQETLDRLESLNATALRVGAEVGKVEGELAASRQWQEVMNLIKDPVTADYAQHGPVALVIAVALHKWLSANEEKFKSYHTVKSGLQNLIKELGGVW